MPIKNATKQARFEAYKIAAPKVIGGRSHDSKAEHKVEGGAAAAMLVGGVGAFATGGLSLIPAGGMAALGALGYVASLFSRNQKFQDFYESCIQDADQNLAERKEVLDQIAEPAVLLKIIEHTDEVGKNDPSALGAYLLADGPTYDLPERDIQAEHKKIVSVLMPHIDNLLAAATADDARAFFARVSNLYTPVTLLANGATFSSLNTLLGDADGTPVIQTQLNALLEKVAGESGVYSDAQRSEDFKALRLAIEALPAAQEVMKTALTDAVKAQLPTLYARGVSLDNHGLYSSEEVAGSDTLLSFIEKKPDVGIEQLREMGRWLRQNTANLAAGAIGQAVQQNEDADEKEIKDWLREDADARLLELLSNITNLDGTVDNENENVIKISRLLVGFYVPIGIGDVYDERVKSQALAFAKKGYSAQEIKTLFKVNISAEDYFDAALSACTGADDFQALVDKVKNDQAVFHTKVNLKARKLVEKGVTRDAILDVDDTITIDAQVTAELKAITEMPETDNPAQIQARNDDFLKMVAYFHSFPDDKRDARDAAITKIVASAYALSTKGISEASLSRVSPAVTSASMEAQIAAADGTEAEKKAAKLKLRSREAETGRYRERLLPRMKDWLHQKYKDDCKGVDDRDGPNEDKVKLRNIYYHSLEGLRKLSDDKLDKIIASASYKAFENQYKETEADSQEQKAQKKVLSDMVNSTLTFQEEILTRQGKLFESVLEGLDAKKTMAELCVADGALDTLFKKQDEVLAGGLYKSIDRVSGPLNLEDLESGDSPTPRVASGGAQSPVFAQPALVKESAIQMEAQARKLKQQSVEDERRVSSLRDEAKANRDGTAAPVRIVVDDINLDARALVLVDAISSAADFHQAAHNFVFSENPASKGALALLKDARAAQEEAEVHSEWSIKKLGSRSADERKLALDAVGTINSRAMKYAETTAAKALTVLATPLPSEVEGAFLQQKALRDFQAEINSVTVDTATGELTYHRNGDATQPRVTIIEPVRLKEQLQVWQSGLKKFEEVNKTADVLQGDEHFNAFMQALSPEITAKYTIEKEERQKAMRDAQPFFGTLSSSYGKPFEPIRQELKLAKEARTKNHGLIASLTQLATNMSAIKLVFNNAPKSVSMYVTLKLMLGGDAFNSPAYQFLTGKQDELNKVVIDSLEVAREHYQGLRASKKRMRLSGYEYGDSSGFTRYFSEGARKRKAELDDLSREISMQYSTILQLQEIKDYLATATVDNRFHLGEFKTLYDESKAELKTATIESIKTFNGRGNDADDKDVAAEVKEAVGFGGGVEAKDGPKLALTNKIKHFINEKETDLKGGSWRTSYFKDTTVHRTAGGNGFYLRPQETSWNPRAETDHDGGMPAGDRNRLGVSMEMLSMKLQAVMVSHNDDWKDLDGNALFNARQRFIKQDVSIIYKNPHGKSELKKMTIVNLAVGAHVGIFDLENFATAGIKGLDANNAEHRGLVTKAIALEKTIEDTVKRSPEKLGKLLTLLKQRAQPAKLDDAVKEVENAIYRPLARMSP